MTSGGTGGCRRWPAVVLPGITVLLIIICSLPVLVERFVLPSLPVFSAGSPYRVNVGRFGPGGATFYLSAQGAEAGVRSGTLRLDWSVSGLLNRRLDLVELDGLQINFPAPGRPGSKPSLQFETAPASAPFVPPLTVTEVRVRNSTLLLDRQQSLQALPFSATIRAFASDPDKQELSYRGELNVAGLSLRAQMRWDMAGGRVFGRFKGGAALSNLAGLLSGREVALKRIAGRVELDVLCDVAAAPLRVTRLEAEIRFPGLGIDVAGAELVSSAGTDALVAISGGGEAYRVKARGFALNAPLVATAGLQGRLSLSGGGPLWQGDLLLRAAPGSLANGRLNLPGGLTLRLAHQVRRPEQGDMTVAEVVLEDSTFELVEQDIQLRGVRLRLPLVWPPQDTKAGEFLIDDILLARGRLGSFAGQLRQQENTLTLAGALRSTLLPEDAVALNARLRPDADLFAEVDFNLDNGRLDLRNLVPLFPALETVTGTADVDISGTLRFGSRGLDGEFSAGLDNGDFALEDGSLELDGVRLGLRVPSLKHPATDPDQLLQIGELRSAGLVISDVRSRFRVESPDSLFIERIAGRWSGGRVFTSGFRLAGDRRELEVALICDRLELAGILSQLGLAEAEGEGRLSGRIPLRYRGGEIFIDDGFLFTSPGEKGTLKVRQSRYLAQALPREGSGVSPLYFAGAALRDFEYNWARLNIVSEEDDLFLKLQIDGRPGKRLPYRFDAGSNVFVRLPEGTGGGLDQPVRLDVNFRIPINDLFRYQAQLMPLFRQFN